FREALLALLADPGHVAVGADQHGLRWLDGAEYWKLPYTCIPGVDQLNPIQPWRDVEGARLVQVEEHGTRIVEQAEHAQRAVAGDEVEVGDAPPEQRVSLAEVVVN